MSKHKNKRIKKDPNSYPTFEFPPQFMADGGIFAGNMGTSGIQNTNLNKRHHYFTSGERALNGIALGLASAVGADGLVNTAIDAMDTNGQLRGSREFNTAAGITGGVVGMGKAALNIGTSFAKGKSGNPAQDPDQMPDQDFGQINTNIPQDQYSTPELNPGGTEINDLQNNGYNAWNSMGGKLKRIRNYYPNGGELDSIQPVVAYQGKPQTSYLKQAVNWLGDIDLQDLSNSMQPQYSSGMLASPSESSAKYNFYNTPRASAYQTNLPLGNKMYANGGMLSEANGGFIHEDPDMMNINSGIPIGEQSVIEKGETMFNPESYVFSDRIKIPGGKGTFAKKSKSIKNRYSLRPEDKLSKSAMEGELADLMNLQESVKQAKAQEHLSKAIELDSNIMAYGGIHINPANKGKFTASANHAGMGVQEYAHHVMGNPNASPLQRKRANFAIQAAKWHHAQGGPLDGIGGDETSFVQYDEHGNAIGANDMYAPLRQEAYSPSVNPNQTENWNQQNENAKLQELESLKTEREALAYNIKNTTSDSKKKELKDRLNLIENEINHWETYGLPSSEKKRTVLYDTHTLSEEERGDAWKNHLPDEKTDFNKMSFSEAFGAARKQGMEKFTWKGKSYGTRLKGETKTPTKMTPPVVSEIQGAPRKFPDGGKLSYGTYFNDVDTNKIYREPNWGMPAMPVERSYEPALAQYQARIKSNSLMTKAPVFNIPLDINKKDYAMGGKRYMWDGGTDPVNKLFVGPQLHNQPPYITPGDITNPDEVIGNTQNNYPDPFANYRPTNNYTPTNQGTYTQNYTTNSQPVYNPYTNNTRVDSGPMTPEDQMSDKYYSEINRTKMPFNSLPIKAGMFGTQAALEGLRIGLTPNSPLVGNVYYDRINPYTQQAIAQQQANQALASAREGYRNSGIGQAGYNANLTMGMGSLGTGLGANIANIRNQADRVNAGIQMNEANMNKQLEANRAETITQDRATRSNEASKVGAGLVQNTSKMLTDNDLRNMDMFTLKMLGKQNYKVKVDPETGELVTYYENTPRLKKIGKYGGKIKK